MSLDPVILGYLRLAPMSGYKLKKHVETSVGNFWSITFGGLYPALNRMLEQGDIDISNDANSGSSTTYTLTEQGRERLEEWLHAPVKQYVVKDEFLLKVFFATDAELAALSSQVSKRLAVVSERLMMLEQLQDQGVVKRRGARFCLEIGITKAREELSLLKELNSELHA